MLTDAQSLQINSVAQYSHDYEAEALASFEATGDDLMEELQERFESLIAYETTEDLGGLSVYFNGNTLVAFYDYERFVGNVFLKTTLAKRLTKTHRFAIINT